MIAGDIKQTNDKKYLFNSNGGLVINGEMLKIEHNLLRTRYFELVRYLVSMLLRLLKPDKRSWSWKLAALIGWWL